MAEQRTKVLTKNTQEEKKLLGRLAVHDIKTWYKTNK